MPSTSTTPWGNATLLGWLFDTRLMDTITEIINVIEKPTDPKRRQDILEKCQLGTSNNNDVWKVKRMINSPLSCAYSIVAPFVWPVKKGEGEWQLPSAHFWLRKVVVTFQVYSIHSLICYVEYHCHNRLLQYCPYGQEHETEQVGDDSHR